MRKRFLDHLAATCNVRASAAAAGVDGMAPYHLRRSDAAFAAAWGEALAAGYEVLETRLVGHALAGGGAEVAGDGPDAPGPIAQDLAMRLLANRRGALTGKVVRKGSFAAGKATAEETDRAILAKLAAMAKVGAKAGTVGEGAKGLPGPDSAPVAAAGGAASRPRRRGGARSRAEARS